MKTQHINDLLDLQRKVIDSAGDNLKEFRLYDKTVIDRRTVMLSIDWIGKGNELKRFELDLAYVKNGPTFLADRFLHGVLEEIENNL